MKVLLDSFKQARSKANIWLIPVFEGGLPAASRAFEFDPGQPRTWGFDGQLGQSLTVLRRAGHQHAILIGAGKPKEFNVEKARQIIGKAVQHTSLQKAKASNVLFAASPLADHKVSTESLAEALAEGAVLGSYSFVHLKGTGTAVSTMPSFPNRLIVSLPRVSRQDRRRFNEGLIMARWTNWGRDLLNLPQSHITAIRLAEHARKAAQSLKRIRCTIWGAKEIAAARMGLLLAVNQGSTEPPRFIILQYNGGKAREQPICLVGKGLTYDTGGYNIKPGESMRGMHMDKGGAVGALASFFALVELGVKRNLVCLVPSTDNRISASAMVPGDVFKSLSGITVEVDNTDAEGRLVLADALAYAKKFNPSHIVDMATLTGAAVVALGNQASALFCNDDRLATDLLKHAEDAGELIWRMPLWSEYNDKLKSKTADIKNVGDRWGGAITAALFLQRFVPDGVTWCHLDIAGKMAAENDHPYTPTGSGYGFGPRLLCRWLRGN